MNRRAVLGGLAMGPLVTAAASAAPAAKPALKAAALPWTDPAWNVHTSARLSADAEPGVEAFTHYIGKTFLLAESGEVTPIYGIEGIGALRTLPAEAGAEPGAVKFLMNEVSIYTDLATGKPLETWHNPLTGRDVEVWHNRNGPVNFELKPSSPSPGNFERVGAQPTQGYALPWVHDDDRAWYALDVTAKRKNPLDPATWKLESSGETTFTSEHSQYFVRVSDLANEALTSLPFDATLESLKAWQPWMLMGQRPGKLFTRTVAHKVAGHQAMAPAVRAYAEAHLAQWMHAPTEWTGVYVTANAIFAKERTPAP